jgi:hypothetical protein
MARELLLRGGYVVTVDDSLRDLPNGDVLIRDDQVAAGGDVSIIFAAKTDAYYGGQRRSASQYCSGQKPAKERIGASP